MDLHKDEDVKGGISISIGSTAVFRYEDKKILLEEGDVLVGEFD